LPFIFIHKHSDYICSLLEVNIEADSNDAMEIKTEADRNDVTKCAHHDHPYAAMSSVSDAIFSTFICLSMTCIVFTVLVLCTMSTILV